MTKGAGVDWEVLAKCQYGIINHYAYGGTDVNDCGEPATHKVWWRNDASDAMFVCQVHFEEIRRIDRTLKTDAPMLDRGEKWR